MSLVVGYFLLLEDASPEYKRDVDEHGPEACSTDGHEDVERVSGRLDFTSDRLSRMLHALIVLDSTRHSLPCLGLMGSPVHDGGLPPGWVRGFVLSYQVSSRASSWIRATSLSTTPWRLSAPPSK